MSKYNHFISENIAPKNAKHIAVYNEQGNRVGKIPLGNLAFPKSEVKKYSFGALSDVHLSYTTGESDFITALNYFNNTNPVDFICISGDLSDVGTDARLSRFAELVSAYSPNLPIYVSAGNHDAYDASHAIRPEAEVNTSMLTHTGNPLYYSFEYNNDVFIFVGICNGTFSQPELQWLYETLEANRNKRCFLFEHVFAFEGCGNAFGLYTYNLIDNTMGNVYKSLLRHYHNVIWFHGHSHTKFHGQEYNKMANYDKVFGCHSVHVPSIAVPRTDADGDYEFQIEYQDSEGYVVDVYENGIHLRGRDFVAREFLSIASYWLDTTLQEIEEKTYVDPTGIINTSGSSGEEEEEAPFVYTNVLASATDASGNVLNGTGYKNSSRFSGYGGNMAQDTSTSGYFTTGFIPYTNEQLKNGTPFHVKGITLNLASLPSYLRFTCCVPGSKDWVGAQTITDMTNLSQMTIYQLADDYFVFVPNVDMYSVNAWNTKTLTHIRWCLPGNGENVIITVGELMGIGRNIPLNLKLGKLDSSTGQLISDPDGRYTYSDEITINPEKKYIFTLNNCLASAKVCYYDASGAFLSCSDNVINIGQSDRIASGSCRIPLIDGAVSFRMRPVAKWYGNSYADSNALIFAGASLVECSEI